MPQVFPKSMNVVARLTLLGLPLVLGGGIVTGAAFYRSDYSTGAREVVEQPVPFSHKHHVSELGIGCQYCHTAVEHSNQAGLPPTKTCMNCHQQMWTSADLLDPVRKSYQNDVPIDEMALVYQSKTLLMEWCLDCHRNPEKHLRPRDEVYNMKFQASDVKKLDGTPYKQLELGRELKEKHQVRESSILTNCSICHR